MKKSVAVLFANSSLACALIIASSVLYTNIANAQLFDSTEDQDIFLEEIINLNSSINDIKLCSKEFTNRHINELERNESARYIFRNIIHACETGEFYLGFNGGQACETRQLLSGRSLQNRIRLTELLIKRNANNTRLIIKCLNLESINISISSKSSARISVNEVGSIIVDNSSILSLELDGVSVKSNLQINDSNIKKLMLQNGAISGGIYNNNVEFDFFEIYNYGIGGNFSLIDAKINKAFTVTKSIVSGYISISTEGNTNFVGNQYGSVFKGDFSFSDNTVGKAISFYKLKIASNKSSSTDGSILFSNIKASSIYIKDTSFDGVLISPNNTISDGLFINNSFFNSGLEMSSITSTQIVITNSNIRGSATFNRCSANTILISQKGTDIDGKSSFYDFSRCRAQSINIEKLNANQFLCRFCVISNDLYISGSFYAGIDVYGARIDGGIFFEKTRWREESLLNLGAVASPRIHADVADLKFSTEGNSNFVKSILAGFEYRHFGSSTSTSGSNLKELSFLDQSPEELIKWILSGMRNFDPQPFATLAKVLTESGNKDTANELNRYRVSQILGRSSLFQNRIKYFLGIPVGYGYKPDVALVIILGMIIFGFVQWSKISWYYCYKCLPISDKVNSKNFYIKLLESSALSLYASIVRLFPSATGLCGTVKHNSEFETDDRWKSLRRYFLFHTFAGSFLIFLLLTPLIGFFD